MAIRFGVTRCRRSQRGAAEISEFIPVVYVLFLIVFLPLINLGALFVAATTQYLATNDFASKASTQADYASALNTMVSESYQFQSTGLANFIAMTPEGGYTGCGDDLYVVTTNIATGTPTSSLPDTPLPAVPSVDTVANIYELSVTSTYSVAPLINLSAVPILGAVPGLGQPVTLTFTANRPVEHPGGLQTVAAATGGAFGGPSSYFSRVLSGSATDATASNVTWRTPNIYQQIKNAHQTIVSVNVFVVQANNPNWTPSGVTVASGENVWIDTQAIGTWSYYPMSQQSSSVASLVQWDANGSTFMRCSPNPDATALGGSLVGVVGGGAVASNPNAFLVGDTLTNYSLTGAGQLYMMANLSSGQYASAPSYGAPSSWGAQMVRVIVTQ